MLDSQSWTCLAVRDGPGIVPEEIACSLQIAACRLHMKRADADRFENAICSGYIETEWESHSLGGGHGGIVFKSIVETDMNDKYAVNFLMNERVLEAASEAIEKFENERMVAGPLPHGLPHGALSDIEALHEFLNLHPRTLH